MECILSSNFVRSTKMFGIPSNEYVYFFLIRFRWKSLLTNDWQHLNFIFFRKTLLHFIMCSGVWDCVWVCLLRIVFFYSDFAFSTSFLVLAFSTCFDYIISFAFFFCLFFLWYCQFAFCRNWIQFETQYTALIQYKRSSNASPCCWFLLVSLYSFSMIFSHSRELYSSNFTIFLSSSIFISRFVVHPTQSHGTVHQFYSRSQLFPSTIAFWRIEQSKIT